jgi:hypothetical protein
VYISGTVLDIVGDAANHSIAVDHISSTQTRVYADGIYYGPFSESQFSSIMIEPGNGND